MLRLSNANAIVIQGLIAQKGLDCLKALDSWKFENKPEGEGEGEGGEGKITLVLRAPPVAIGAQKVGTKCFPNTKALLQKIWGVPHKKGRN